MLVAKSLLNSTGSRSSRSSIIDKDVQRCSRIFKLIAALIFVWQYYLDYDTANRCSLLSRSPAGKGAAPLNWCVIWTVCLLDVFATLLELLKFPLASCRKECFEFSTSNFCTSLWFIWFLALVPMTSLSSKTLFATLSRHPELERAWTIVDIWRLIWIHLTQLLLVCSSWKIRYRLVVIIVHNARLRYQPFQPCQTFWRESALCRQSFHSLVEED